MNAKILVGALIIAILIGILWMGNTQIVDCSKITSSKNIEKCVGKNIGAIGILQCQKPERNLKLDYLTLADKTGLTFLEEYTNCDNVDGKMVKIAGYLYKCGTSDQCVGVGIKNIESVSLAE